MARLLWLEETARGEFDAAGKLVRIKGLTRDTTHYKQAELALADDVTERRRAEEHKTLLLAELDHRVKNTLATVNAVVCHTHQGSRSVPDFAAALEGRFRSMAATHELLSARWAAVAMPSSRRRTIGWASSGDNSDGVLRPQLRYEPTQRAPGSSGRRQHRRDGAQAYRAGPRRA
jgi:hypothetical protein